MCGNLIKVRHRFAVREYLSLRLSHLDYEVFGLILVVAIIGSLSTLSCSAAPSRRQRSPARSREADFG